MAKKEIAVFGAGCFWHVELALSKLKGVLETKAGYMGGDEEKYPNPTYKEVCTDKTRYAEVVKVIYDADKISYSELLDFFWNNHNPTTLNRQGLDIGTQYRSVIFYFNDKQKKIAEASKKKMQKKLSREIVTQIVKAGRFFEAEEYHQRYLEKRGLPICPI